jgi:energy-coupling factor transporter ATP-binding protein EcfA2
VGAPPIGVAPPGPRGADEGEQEGTLQVGDAPAGAVRGRAGLVLQDPQAQTVLARCGDDVAFGCENLGVPRDEIWPRVREALDAVGLDVALDRSTEHLSGGQRQRLALAGVLAMRPGLLLLDEPTANLDPDGVREVRDAVASALGRTGATLVVVEHRVDVWVDLVDRVVVLAPGGGVLADGSPDQVLAARGTELAAAGVWVPGHPPPRPHRRPDPARARGERLLTASALAVGRPGAGAVAAGIDLDVVAGSALAVTGPNGAGKTTLALTLGGLLPPLAGTVEAAPVLRGRLRPAPHAWRARELFTRVGTVFQDPEHQFVAPTVRAELEHGPRRLGEPAAEVAARADELLERLRLTRLAPANPWTLSGGEKRRLSVATALATRPRVLVLDEPTFGQDARTWAEVVALLAGLLDDGAAAVLVTHDGDVVDALADVRLDLGDHACS